MTEMMRRLALTMMVCTLLPVAALAKDVVVSVSGIDTGRTGKVLVMLFGEEGYPVKHDRALSIQSIEPEQETMDVRFDVKLEAFAIKVLHDEDEDGKTTKNWTGFIPAEGMGFSNGARIGLGPPSFNDARLMLNEVAGSVSVPIVYP